MFSHIIAGLAIVASIVGLGFCIAGEARLWGPDSAGISQNSRPLLVLFLCLPQLAGIGTAVVTRRLPVLFPLIAVGGACLNAWLSAGPYFNESLTRTERVLVLMEHWVYQGLVASVIAGIAIEGWRTQRKNAAKPVAAQESSPSSEPH